MSICLMSFVLFVCALCPGDNILGLVLKILEAPEFLHNLPRSDKPRTVYFDFMCIFMVTYSYPMGNLLGKLAIAVSMMSLSWRIKRAIPSGETR